MDRYLIKKAFVAIILLFSFPLLLMYFSYLNVIALWLYAWLIPFCFILFYTKIDLFVKGLLIIAVTVVICAVGTEVIIKNYPNSKDVITNLALILTLMAGGLGGNFMSHELIKRQSSK